jgi:ribosome-binding protein aMBF1 (putative translation factor)
LKNKLTQDALAKKIGEKPSVIVAIENGTGPYVASIINNIEKN